MDLFVAKKALAALVLPPTGLLLVALVGLAARRRKWGMALTAIGVLGLLALSLPPVSHALLRLAAGESTALDLAEARAARAIVILGAGIRRAAAEYGGDTLGRLTLERVRYGAWVARKTNLPLLVSGGSVFGGDAEAVLMKRALEEEFGIEVRWAESRSRNTRSNARESAAILLPLGISNVVLVAHAFDMPRATAEFASAGLHAIPAPTAVVVEHFSADHPLEWLPGMSALQGSYYALYELLARAARHIL